LFGAIHIAFRKSRQAKGLRIEGWSSIHDPFGELPADGRAESKAVSAEVGGT
jgi:hypothetical protein